MNIFVDTTDNALISGTGGSGSNQNFNPLSLPFFYGDQITVNVYLFSRLIQATPSQFQYAAIPSAGKTVSLYITDGKATPTNIWATQTLVPDSSGQFFTGLLALNTSTLQAYFAANPSVGGVAPAPFLKLGLTDGAQTPTVFSQPVNIFVGLPPSTIVPVPPLTPLSLQQANQLYVPVNPQNGGVIYLKSLAGHTLVLYAKDQGDGSVSFQTDQRT